MSDTKKEVKKGKRNFNKIFRYILLYVLAAILSFVAGVFWANTFNTTKTIIDIKSLIGISTNFTKEYQTFQISIPSGLPSETEMKLKDALNSVSFNGKKRFEIVENGELKLEWKEGKGVYTEYIVPVSHFYTFRDIFNPPTQDVYIDKSLPEGIKSLLQTKYKNSKVAEGVNEVLDEGGTNAVLISASKISPDQKLMNIIGNYFLEELEGGLPFTFGLKEENTFVQSIISSSLENSNLSEDQISLDDYLSLNQTGVTAISRSLASKIEAVGDYGYPAKKIAAFLKSTDLTHVSNEVSFVPGCVPVESLRFCSKPEYMKTLTDIGADIVSLTGNHNNDYGAVHNLNTMKSYTKQGMKYFGGGKDDVDAAKILYIEEKGTKLAFVGYNYYDTMLGTGALASKDRAGANSYSVKKMEKDIKEAKKNADIVIVDFQFQECYSYPPSDVIFPICYKALTSPDQKGTFRKAIDFGADIVVGVQAHQPQTYELYKGKPIYYGLGNLFFDQVEWIGTRQGLVLTHYFKDGKLIQTKITTTLYDADMKPYISKGSDSALLLKLLRDARN